MTTRLTSAQKFAIWHEAFTAVREELTPMKVREFLGTITPNDAVTLPAATSMARMVAANDRTAALVAALLVGSGGVRTLDTGLLED